MRVVTTIPSLRGDGLFQAVRSAIAAASGRLFRIVHFSVQADHLHMIVEAGGPVALGRGMQGFAIRAAKAVNRILARRGTVWADRYHARTLATPREVRYALAYVLNNWRKHVPGAQGADPRSSASWFNGWRDTIARTRDVISPVATPRTWLAHVGWRRHGLISLEETPRGAPAR